MSKSVRRSTPTPTPERTAQTAPGAPQTPESASTMSGSSQVSPLILPRLQEKQELARLNDRLSLYLKRVHEERDVEMKDDSDSSSSSTRGEKTLLLNRELSEMRARYDRQIAELHAQLDEAREERAKAETDVGRYRGEADDWKEKFLKKDSELHDVKKRLSAADAKNSGLQARLSESSANITALEYQVTRTKEEMIRMEEQISTFSHSQDDESSARFNLEERLLAFKEEMAFKAEIQKQLQDLRDIAERNERHALVLGDKLKLEQQRNENLTAQITELENVRVNNDRRIKALEAKLKSLQEDHDVEMKGRDNELGALKTQLAELMDVKIALDVEIAAYRRLLDVEEVRLNSKEPRQARTQSRVAAVVRGTKRKAVEELSTTSAFNIVSTNKGSVEIQDTDPDGKHIRLYNTSDRQVVSIGNWQLKHTSGDKEAVFKFHHSMQLKANSVVSVYSSDSGATHAPPNDLVMKTQKWPTSEHMKTVLLNAQGEEVALREMTVKTTTSKETS